MVLKKWNEDLLRAFIARQRKYEVDGHPLQHSFRSNVTGGATLHDEWRSNFRKVVGWLPKDDQVLRAAVLDIVDEVDSELESNTAGTFRNVVLHIRAAVGADAASVHPAAPTGIFLLPLRGTEG